MSGLTRRAVIGAAAAGAALPAFAATRGWDAVVSKTGGAAFTTLGEALARAADAKRPFRILLDEGVYDEKLVVTAPDVTIIGRNLRAVITHDTAAGTPKPGGGTWGTGGSATLTIAAPRVTLEGLTIRNGFDYLANRRRANPIGAQAVALEITAKGDRTWLRDCHIESYQDTLYVQARTLAHGCRIAGTTDFIFGGGAALFDQCQIVTRLVPGAELQGYVAAPSTPADQRFGLVFRACHLEREQGVPDRSAYLGRPWRAGGDMKLVGAAAYLDCWMDAHIRPEGWTAMGYGAPGAPRKMLAPHDARLVEWHSIGPGAGPAGPERRLLSDREAAAYIPEAILDGWYPR